MNFLFIIASISLFSPFVSKDVEHLDEFSKERLEFFTNKAENSKLGLSYVCFKGGLEDIFDLKKNKAVMKEDPFTLDEEETKQ